MINASILTGLGRVLGASCLMGAVCWKTAEVAAPLESEVIVHVTQNGVEVTIDEQIYLLADQHAGPIVCHLRPGRHLLTMRRESRVLYREEFLLRAGEDRVLTAWAQPDANWDDDWPALSADEQFPP
jgi:hypothetical protein